MVCLSEFKWLWLFAGSRCLQCDGLREVGVLDEVCILNIAGWGGGGMKKRGGETKIFRKEATCWVKKWVH